MGDIRVHEFMSLDGVIDEPRWTFEYGFDPKMGEALAGAMADCQGILLGRITYEHGAQHAEHSIFAIFTNSAGSWTP